MNKEYITETALKGEYRGKPQTCMGTGACQDPSCRDVLTYYFSADRELITSISAIATALGGLEPEYMHCAMMAELALKRAVLDYAGKRKEGQPVKAAPPM